MVGERVQANNRGLLIKILLVCQDMIYLQVEL